MENQQLRSDELEALAAIYGQDWIVEDSQNNVYSIVVKSVENSDGSPGAGDWQKSITIQIRMPSDYPLEAPPLYTLSAPWMSREMKIRLMNALEEIYCQNSGESIVYMWIEKVREFLSSDDGSSEQQDQAIDDCAVSDDVSSSPSKGSIDFNFTQHHHHTDAIKESATIYHGEPIIDRRSSFQAHLAPVGCQSQAKQAVELLKTNKKIAGATHNITAYRISGGPHNTCIQDCDDDGETHAGARLLHLLQILDVRDVVVMVSRWYGGIQLGPDRFKHINNVARDLLEKSGFLDNNQPPDGNQCKQKSKKAK